MNVDNSSAERHEPSGSSGLSPLARRRLIKSALGTPVVLSSLASKPVLGGTHGCGPSNVGSPTPNSHSPAVNCSTLGQSAAHWTNPMTTWPSNIKRKPPSNESTKFNGFQGLNDKFFMDKNGGGTRPATMLEVLKGKNREGDSRLGRATVVSLLNAYYLPTSYPVTPPQIVLMFNAASNGRDYPIGSGSATLTPTQVLGYLESLYPPS